MDTAFSSSAAALVTSPDVTEFQFPLRGKIITMDHGGAFVGTTISRSLSDLGSLVTIAVDPADVLHSKSQVSSGQLVQHHYHHVALGDGAPATLHICEDSTLSGTLAPLPTSRQVHAFQQSARILGTQTIPTIRLDDVSGLERIDWLILNSANDNLAILHGAQRLLPQILIVQVQTLLVQAFENQAGLTELTSLMACHGFKLIGQFNLDNPGKSCDASPALQDTVFMPDDTRLQGMSSDLRWKLAFLLHSAYRMPDLAYHVLRFNDQGIAEGYLAHSGWLTAPNLSSTPHALPGKLIVSLTSYPKRFRTLHLTLRALLNQSIRPDLTILWISHADRDLLPAHVLELQNYGLTIRYCDDLKSYKKFIYTVNAEPDAFIVVADDDLHYPENWLEKLVSSWNGDMNTVVAWRAHKVRLNQENMPMPYRDWEWAYDNPTTISALLFPTSGFGTLYPPRAFHHDVLDVGKFMALSPNADDIWLYWMTSLNGKKTKVVGDPSDFISWFGSQQEALWKDNVLRGQNDIQINNMIKQYGWAFTD